MKKVEIQNNQCTVTLDPDKGLPKEGGVCLAINKPPRYGRISLTLGELDTLQETIREFKSRNWLHYQKQGQRI